MRTAYLRALAQGETRVRSVTTWIEEMVRTGPARVVAAWRAELEIACAIAIAGYEHARGDAPSAVPEEEG